MHSKGNCKQGEKTTLRMGENDSKWNNWQRIHFQNIQEAHTIQTWKTNHLMKKWEKDLNRHFIKKIYRWLTNTWRGAQHCSLLEKCKSNLQWDIISHWSEWPINLQTINAGEGVEKREHSCTASGNVNWYSHYGGWYGDSLKN